MSLRDATWRSALGEDDAQNRERRRAQREIADFLRSDLYERDPLADKGSEVVWRSPLGWRVRFQAEPTTWRCVIERPDGKEHARLERCFATDLDAVLP